MKIYKQLRLTLKAHTLLKNTKKLLLEKGTIKLPPELQSYCESQNLKTWTLSDVVQLGCIAIMHLLTPNLGPPRLTGRILSTSLALEGIQLETPTHAPMGDMVGHQMTCTECGNTFITHESAEHQRGTCNKCHYGDQKPEMTGDLYSSCPKCGNQDTEYQGTEAGDPIYRCKKCGNEFFSHLQYLYGGPHPE